MELCFSCSGTHHCLHLVASGASVDHSNSIITAKMSVDVSQILSQQQGILSHSIVCNAHH
jgi:hypothetical protein